MNIDEIEVKIRAAVAEAKAKGWRIIKGAYYLPSVKKDGRVGPCCCCPLGALVIDQIEDASAKAAVPERAACRLGISYRDAVAIAQGVDDRGADTNPPNRERMLVMVALGFRLRDLVDR